MYRLISAIIGVEYPKITEVNFIMNENNIKIKRRNSALWIYVLRDWFKLSLLPLQLGVCNRLRPLNFKRFYHPCSIVNLKIHIEGF